MLLYSRTKPRAARLATALLLLLSAALNCAAQSSDPGFPAPIYSNEIGGRIAPRDLGDARRTRHFYIFRGTEGDVLVTLEGSELVGDLDVFTATTQRPILKITLLGDPARVTKSFYVRKEETLILRVEARAAGDIDGTYRITFGGSFAPAPTDLASAPQPPDPTVSSAERRGKNTRRVTSTGARIEEPVVVAQPKVETKETEATPAASNEKAARKEPAAPRRARGSSRTNSSRTRAGATKPKPTSDTAKSDAAETKPGDDASAPAETKTDAETKADAETPATSSTNKPAPRKKGPKPSRRGARSESAANAEPAPSQPAAEAQPTPAAPSQRLVIVTKDGETLERDMGTVRRVTVENNQLVVVSKDGKVTRQPMANVLRMSIEP